MASNAIAVFIVALVSAVADEAHEAFSMVQMNASAFLRAKGTGSEKPKKEDFACLLLDPEIHGAVSKLLSGPDASAEAVGTAWSALGQQHGCHSKTKHAVTYQPAVLQHKESLLKMMGSFDHLTLNPLHQVTLENGTTVFTFQSVDKATGSVGTGRLGQYSENSSVSEVVIRSKQNAPFLWDLNQGEMEFTIGPAIAGMYLISGHLWPQVTSASGISGQMKAGFVNLHSTATGTWNTGPQGFNGNLTLNFGGFLQKSWTWQP